MALRGVRGATVVAEDNPDAILSATTKLLEAIRKANPSLLPDDIASILFTVTDDLCTVYPAQAARSLGWELVPLMCGREMPVPDGLPHCIRVLLHWNTNLSQTEVHHVYLGEAARLRPDLNHERI
jgi:chorismate mutase